MKFNSIRTEGDTVYVSLVGPQSPAVASDMLARFRQALDKAHAKHHKVYVFVDLSGVSLKDVGSDARLAMKEAFTLPFERLAAVGHSHMMEVAMYLMKASGADKRAQYFTSERNAYAWLRSDHQSVERLSGAVLVCGIIVGLIGVSSLIGWYINNEYLTRWLTFVRPINPMGSVGLILLGLSVTAFWARLRRVAMVGATLAMAIGVLALLPLNIDFWIMGDRVRRADEHIRLADSAAWCFILAGVSMWLLNLRRRFSPQIIRIFSAVILFIALLNIFGQLYAPGFLYGLGSSFGSALNLAAGLAVMGSLLAISVSRERLEALRRGMSLIGWLTIAVLVLVQIATYASWRQTVDRNKSTSSQAFLTTASNLESTIDERFRAYVDALHGFRGLFESSEFVGDDEFQQYYGAVRLGQNYPGLRSLVYISRSRDADLPKLVAQQQAERKNENPADLTPFVIKQKAAVPVHYVVTYIAAASNNAVIGTDITSDPSRSGAFKRAEQTGDAVSSGTINLAASPSSPAGKGFFIAVPVGSGVSAAQPAPGPDRYEGFVGAVFNYDALFSAMFTNSKVLHDVSVQISDGKSGPVIYDNQHHIEDVGQSKTIVVPTADRSWYVSLQAPAAYGTSDNQAGFPTVIVASGQLFSVLLLVLLLVLGRSRRSALQLADTITADLHKERNLAVQLQQKDEAILSSIGDAVFALDTDDKIVLFNDAASRISGYSVEEALGKPYTEILSFVYDKDGRPYTDFIEKARAGSLASMEEPTSLIRKDGTRIPVADSAAPIRDASGSLIGEIVVFRDDSNDRALRNERRQLETILSSLPVGVFVAEAPSGKALLANAKAEELVGLSLDQKGDVDDYMKAYHIEKADGSDYPFEEMPMVITLKTGMPAIRDDMVIRHEDGSTIGLRAASAPVLDEDGVMRRVVTVTEDMSKERELDRAKTEFVSLASHQLRTPLSAINWYAEMLLDKSMGKLSDTQHEYAQEIYDGNQRMVELVNALLDVSRLDLGKLTNEPQEVSMTELTDSVLKELAPSIERKKQQVLSRVDAKLSQLQADPKLLRMIVQNLLSNAVKYTPEKGSVGITVKVATDAVVHTSKLKAGKPYMVLQVSDTGYGIPKSQQANIFGKLFRADNVRKLDVEGTGLGLYIVKELADKLGGTVWFDSVENKGTTFTVVLPMAVAAKKENVREAKNAQDKV